MRRARTYTSIKYVHKTQSWALASHVGVACVHTRVYVHMWPGGAPFQWNAACGWARIVSRNGNRITAVFMKSEYGDYAHRKIHRIPVRPVLKIVDAVKARLTIVTRRLFIHARWQRRFCELISAKLCQIDKMTDWRADCCKMPIHTAWTNVLMNPLRRQFIVHVTCIWETASFKLIEWTILRIVYYSRLFAENNPKFQL